ncbi:MAG TPA: hypothetical protein VFE58_14720 [Tepidisphaeraceae bacterium]|jgi:hypothetical protein|nr:hypothetical protein [Tepidisphaeraceae bacterium]
MKQRLAEGKEDKSTPAFIKPNVCRLQSKKPEGKRDQGILVMDFYRTYDQFPGSQQKCLKLIQVKKRRERRQFHVRFHT